MKRQCLRIIMLLLILVCTVLLSGCRESTVIQEIIYDQAAEDIDFRNEMKVVKNIEDSPIKDKTLLVKKNDKTDKETKEKHQASKKGDEKNDGEATKTKYNQDATNNQENDSNGSKSDENGESEQPAKDDSEAGPSENPNDRQVYDSNGNMIDLPEDVNSVVVTGAAAPIVQMLGGEGIISGTSSSFTGNQLALQVFSGEIGETETLWDGDGSSVMSSANFSKLLQMKPDVCMTVSGQSSFSTSQMQTLQEKKIAVVTLPSMTSYNNIKDAVGIVGEVIGDRSGEDGGVNGSKLASDYVDYCDDLIAEVKGKTGLFTWNNIDFNTGSKNAKNTASDGQYTLYVSEWESSVYKIANSSGTKLYEDSGVAVAPQGYSNSPLSYFLSVAGVCNNGARFVQDTRSEYAVVPLNRNVFKHTTSGSHSFYSDKNESFARVKSSSLDVGLGEEQFKAIIVGSSTAKNKIENSKTWKSQGKVTANNVTDYGFLGSDGSLITSYVRGDYDVYVNPCGVGSWTDGSAESVLETVWAAWKFHGDYSESQVKSKIKEFYSKFYRYDLSDSQINSILSGK